LTLFNPISEEVYYEKIEQIIKVPVENKITLILLHHENEGGSIKGSKALLDIFPYVYRLREHEEYHKLYLDNEKARSMDRKTFILERKFEEKYFATHNIIEIVPYKKGNPKKNIPNLTGKIESILKNHSEPTISLNVLHHELKDKGTDAIEKSIKNSLKELKDKKIVEMTISENNKMTWDTITSVANNPL
jgi:hypothetical protein